MRRGLAWSTASNIVLRIGNLAIGIIMARLIAPESFGVFAVALTVWTVLGSVAEFGLGADLVRRADYERLIPTVATLGAILSTSLAVAMFFFSSSIATLFGTAQATNVIQLMSIPLFLIGLSVVPAALLQRKLQQGTLFAIDGSALAISTALTVVLALAGLGPAALAYGRIAGQGWTVLMQYVAARRWPVFGWSTDVAREAVSFGMPLAFANVISWLIIGIDNLVVARETNALQLGFYALAFSISSWPMSVAGQSVRVVALPAFSRLPTPQQRGRAMLGVSGLIWSVSALVAVGLMFTAPQVVSLLYGERWEPAVAAIVPLAAFGALRVVFDLTATYLISCGHTRSVLVVQVIWVAALIPSLIVGVRLGGLAGAGWAHMVIAIVIVLPAYLVCLRRAQVPSLKFLGAWVFPTLTGIPLAAALWLVTSHITSTLAALALAGGAAVVLYVLPMSKWAINRTRALAQI